MRDWHSYTGSHSKCGNDQLVCSLDRRHLSWNGYELYNAEYQYNYDILRRCNGWWVYDSNEDGCNRYNQYYTYDNGYDPRIKMRHRYGYTGSYSKRRYDQLVRSRFGRGLPWDRYELYNTKYQYNYYILCRCNGWRLYDSDKDSSNSDG